jgi:hypothetical protein
VSPLDNLCYRANILFIAFVTIMARTAMMMMMMMMMMPVGINK